MESELEACSGAYMIMPRKIYEITGGFDPDYFMYAEDLDLCKLVRDAGYKVWYYPKTKCIHYKGKSSGKVAAFALFHFHDTMWIYYKKHYQNKYSWLMSLFVYTGIWGRYYWLSFLNIFRKKKVVSK
ncbi:MAG: glycosyltransferase [Candidatus Doudnabacteria bacterium]